MGSVGRKERQRSWEACRASCNECRITRATATTMVYKNASSPMPLAYCSIRHRHYDLRASRQEMLYIWNVHVARRKNALQTTKLISSATLTRASSLQI